jgi:hypothetical protein
VVNAVAQVVAAAIAAAQSGLQIHSPSKVFRKDIDVEVPAGMALGVEGGIPAVVKSIKRMNNAIVDTASKVVIPGPRIDSALTGSLGSAVASENRVTSVGAGSGLGGGVAGGDTYVINGYPNATAVQLANLVSFRQRYSRKGVHSGR